MNPDLVIACVISIALAFAVGPIVARKLNRKYLPSIVVSLLLFIIMMTLSGVVILREAGPQDRESQIRAEIHTLPFYEALIEHDPYFPGAVKQEIALSLAHNESKMEALDRVDRLIDRRLALFFPVASDEALIRHASVYIGALEHLLETDTLAAYRFLDEESDDYTWFELLPDLTREELEESLAEVIRSGASTPTPLVDISRADSILSRVIDCIYGQYGDVSMLMTNPALADMNKGNYCRVTSTLYRLILALPQEEGALVLRLLTMDES